jgi:hypothetical protein
MTQPSLMTRPLALAPAPEVDTADATLLAALRQTSSADLIALLFRFELAEPFLRQFKERLVVSQREDLSAPEAIATEAVSQYCSEHNLSTDEERQRWYLLRGMGPNDFLAEAIHEWRRGELRSQWITTSGESLYLRYKDKLDRVLYSLLRVDDPCLCRELFYAIEAGEISFGEAARLHSRGPEAKTQGIVGPVDLTTPHPEIASRLRTAQAGQLIGPFEADEWHMLMRLEYRFDSEYDAHTHKFLEEVSFKSKICSDLQTDLQQHMGWLQGQLLDANHDRPCRSPGIPGGSPGL